MSCHHGDISYVLIPSDLVMIQNLQSQKVADETGLAMLIFALVRRPHNTLLHGRCGAATNRELHPVEKLKPEPASKPMEFPSLDIDM